MKDITRFINDELKPRFFSHIPQIFPELHFTLKGNRYVSNLHADGTEGTGYKEDRSVVTYKKPYGVWDNTRQQNYEIISLFKGLNHITDNWEAIKKLCSIVGILPPEDTPEEKKRYRQQEQKRTALEASAERQKEALSSPEGGEVLEYLHSRGWTDEEIKEAELGYFSIEEAKFLQDNGFNNIQFGAGTAFTLSIPYRSGSNLSGFKLRDITATKANGKQKYTMIGEKDGLFNLTGIQQDGGSIVVVEGELDALHAEVRGVKGIVSTGGGHLTEELLDKATGRGIKHITLLFDKDDRGAEFMRKSIDIAHKKEISVLVATFPDGESLSDGRPIHDIDEYLQAHTPEELQNLINNAQSGSMFLLDDLIQTTLQEYGEANLTDAVELDLRYKVVDLANHHTPNKVERDLILTRYSKMANIDGTQAFSEESLRAIADREREKEDALEIERTLGEALQKAQNLLDGKNTATGKRDVQGAIQAVTEATSKIKTIGGMQKYGDLLRTPSREERIRKFKEKPESLKTSYSFKMGGEVELPFTLPSGALTILAAPTSHGKSTFLRNLAIDVAKRYKDENRSVLYFTFEESEEDVIAQFTNTYIGKRLHAVSKKNTQIDSIIDYFKTGVPNYIGGDKAEIQRDEFVKEELSFSTDYLDSGRIKIYYRDYDLETLIDALEFAVCHIPTKAIFVDYIQILRSQKLSRQPRTEQLKEICISLKDFSVKYKTPVILAAQLKRESSHPLRMNNTQMSESSDIEKAANTIICLWNSSFKVTESISPSPAEKKEMEFLGEKGFELGTEGKLFAIVTKIRGSRGVGMYSVFDFKGYSGKVVENYNPDSPEKEEERPVKKKEPECTSLPF